MSFTDLGEGQKDWLQFLQKQVKQNYQKESYPESSVKTNTLKGSANNDCDVQHLQVEGKAGGDFDDCDQKELQHERNSAKATTSHPLVEGQHRSHKNELVEDWCWSSSLNQDVTKAQLPSEGAPASPLSAFLSTSLGSPTLLLPHGKYLQKCFFLLDEGSVTVVTGISFS